MAGVGTAYVSVRVDTSKFEGDLEKMLARLSTKMNRAGDQFGKDLTKGLKGTDWDAAFKPMVDAGNKASNNVVKGLDRVESKAASVGERTSASGNQMADGFRNARRSLDGVHDALSDVSRETTQVGRAARRIDFSGGAGRGGSALRAAAGSAGFFGRQLDDIAKIAPTASKALASFHNMAAFGGTAMAGLAGGLSAVAQGLFAVGANAAAMAPALAVATSGMLSMLQVGATLGLAMQGVGAAISAGFKAQTATATAASNATKGLGDQVKKLVKPAKVSRDAIIAAKDAVVQAARGIADAKDALARTYQQVAWSASDAARRVRRAESDLAASQVATRQAQQALNDARATALEQLEDIGFAAEDAALGEERASQALDEAYVKLQEVSELSPDNKMRQEAELAFKEAELNLRKAKDAREDADKAQADASATGIEGTQAMVDAHANVADAQANQAQAAQDLADAQREQRRTAIEDAQSIQDAEQGLADARAAHRDALQGVIDAQKDYQQALKDAAAAAAEANKKIKAQNLALAQAPPAVDLFKQAMKDLSPHQQEFVNRIIGMRDEYIKFRNAVADPLFERLLTAMDLVNLAGKDGTTIMDILTESLKGTSKALGDTAIDAANLAKNDVFQASLSDAMENNNQATRHFGHAAVDLAAAFVQVADAAGPLFLKFSKWVQDVAEAWRHTATLNNTLQNANDKFTPLEKTINTAGKRVEEFWGLTKELWRSLKLLGGAANDAANQFGWFDDEGRAQKGYIPMLTDNLKTFNDQLKHKDLVDGFTHALENMDSVAAAVKNFVDPLIKLGQDPRIGQAFDKIGNEKTGAVLDRLGDTAAEAAPALADIAVNVLEVLTVMSESGSSTAFLDVLKTVTGVIADLVNLVPAPVIKAIGIAFGTWRALKFIGGIGKFATAGLVGDLRAIPGKMTAAGDKIVGAGARIETAGKEIATGFETGLTAGLTAAIRQVGVLGEEIYVALKKALGLKQGETIGKDLMTGIGLGIEAGQVAAIEIANSAGAAVGKAIKLALGIKSPSTVGMSVGRDLMAGVAIGIEEGEGAAVAAGASAGSATGAAVGAGAAEGAAVGGVGRFAKIMGPLTKLAKPFSGALRLVGGAFRFMLGPVGMIVLTLLPILWPLLVKLEEKTGIFSKSLDVLKEGLGKVGDFFVFLWDKMKELFNWVKDNWDLLLIIILGPFGLAVGQIIKHWDDIMAAIGAAVGWIKGVLTGMWDGITAGWDAIMAFFNGLWSDHIEPWLTELIANVTALLVTIWDGITTGWDKIVKWAGKLWDYIKQPYVDFFNSAKALLKDIWEVIKDKWIALKTWAGGLWGSISDKFDSLVSSAGGVLKNIWDKITSAWTNLSSFFSGLWGTIRDYITGDNGLLAKAGTQLEKIWDGITSAWGKLSTFFSNLWSDIRDYITGENGLVKKMSGALEGVWAGLGTGLANAWNAVAKWVNAHVIGGINDLLGKFGGGKIDFQLPENLAAPGKAEGGPITGPGGPKDDRILIRASAGEYMLPAKAARGIGPDHLEYMRKHGTLPPMGDIGGVFGAIGGAYNSVKDALSEGAETAVKWIISNAVEKLPNNVMGSIMKSFFEWAADKIIAWGKEKEQKYMATTGGASVFVPDPSNPLGVGTWKGGRFTRRFVAHMQKAEKIAGVSITVIQGGFMPYTSYSGASHQGDAIDSQVSYALIRALRRVGIASGDRTGLGPWRAHAHSIPGPAAGLALGSAPGQWASYMAMGGASQPLNSRWGLAKGGVVAPRAGGLMALIAEGGRPERVTPLDNEGFSPSERKIMELLETKLTGLGSSGDTYNIHPSSQINEAALADLVSRRVSWNRRRGARAG